MPISKSIYLKFLCLCICALPVILSGQTLDYDVLRKGNRIGTMHIERFQQGSNTITRTEMKVEVSFVMTVKMRFTYETHAANGELFYAIVRNYRNGDMTDQTHIQRTADGLRVNKDGDISIEKKAVKYCISDVYYAPPGEDREVFSERWGKFQPFVPLADGRYVMYIANGDKSYYTYKGGICDKVEVHTTMANLIIKRRSSSGAN